MTEPEVSNGALDETFRAQSAVGGRRRRRTVGGRLRGCLPVLLVLAVVGALGYVGLTRGVDFLQDQFAAPEDYSGDGEGEVLFEVVSGDSVSAIGAKLEEAGVVASAEAFTDAASDDQRSTGIQAGFYELRREMSAQSALDVLVDPGRIVTTAVTVPEGLRVDDIVDLLVEQTDFRRGQFQRVLDRPQALGLPGYAGGDPEGYLFPATYAFGPRATPESMLAAMVDRWRQAAADVDLEGRARELGYTPHELMTVASLIEAEASREQDRGKVARVIYNRLENPGTAGTTGKLQIDATINYALGRDLGFAITSEDRFFDSPYNTYVADGLPPGPIEAPGEAAMAAAGNPTPGDWYYYVTVNIDTGETKFAESYEEFLQYDAEFEQFCETSDNC